MAGERLDLPQRLVIASHNAGKVVEIDDLLDPFGIEVIGAASLNLPEPEETGDTFEANAVLKAVAAVEGSGLPALSDDSGLSVWGLDGKPGIHSARWGGPSMDFNAAMARVEQELGDNPDRSASFFCVLSLAWPDGSVRSFEGRVDGMLEFPPRGDHGFGSTQSSCPMATRARLVKWRWLRRRPSTIAPAPLPS